MGKDHDPRFTDETHQGYRTHQARSWYSVEWGLHTPDLDHYSVSGERTFFLEVQALGNMGEGDFGVWGTTVELLKPCVDSCLPHS